MKILWRSLYIRLTGALLTVVAVSLLAAALFSYSTVRSQFDLFLVRRGLHMGQEVATTSPTPATAEQGRVRAGVGTGARYGGGQMVAPPSPEVEFLGGLERGLFWAGLIGLGLALILGFLLFRWLTTPLERLARAADQVAAGDLSVRLPVKNQDELGQVARSFNRMAESLVRERKLRQKMASDLAHELRTPLAVLRGNLEALQDGIYQPEPERFEALLSEVMSLGRLVDDLRDLYLMEEGAFRFHWEKVELGALVRQVAELYRPRAEAKGLGFQVIVPSQLVETKADGARLGQVLRNLLENALAHTAQGEIAVTLITDGPQARVSVRDTGEGILQEDLVNVFERLYRTDSSRNRAIGGTGLGLAIARAIVEAHSGRIWAESSAGQGSTVSFSLPLTGIAQTAD